MIGYLLIKYNVTGASVVLRNRKEEELLVLFKRIVLAMAGAFLCFCSSAFAQDFSHLQSGPDYLAANNSRIAIVSSLPSEVLQPSSGAIRSETVEEEVSAAHQADFLVLLGLGGVLLIGFSIAGICWLSRKRSTSIKHPVTLVGV